MRPLGSDAHDKMRTWLISEMKKYADKTVLQEFKYHDMPVTNVVGVFYPRDKHEAAKAPILLMAHWDTRPIADGPYSSERNTRFAFKDGKWSHETPIMGANDAASGVAVLLELARIFKLQPPLCGVILLLDDGEDYGDFLSNNHEGDGVELGARYFAQHFTENPIFGRPNFGILLDMVGGKNLILPREGFSQRYAPGTNEKVYNIATSMGYGSTFKNDLVQEVGDDHVSINEAGIPTIDLIHPLPMGEYATTGYRYWHTLEDTVANCSAKSLKIVGEVVAEVIYRESAE